MSNNPSPNSSEISQMVYVVQVLEEQKKNISEQLLMTENQLSGINISKRTMEELQSAENNHEIVIPIGTNAFARAKIIEPDKIIIPISRDMFIEKNLEESIKQMEQRLEANNKLHAKLVENYNDINGKIQEIKSKFNQR
ncbi:prefoldin subunit alpha [Promethearchaeum syntrophicum]|uniref:Prefoldin subunit alpha n=1 Tax=Promethearchaeum syntrophicum TaxID=2594042 RepID=A0A5B9DEK1_9ARCH|nr:prefoldin subunit alpha [Candidatus Prometheoarchaeum syntrophicum]QEE17455.1 Prefoldin subunit alpha [Candidatus Prometheoarchaeum syntrophicum]